MKGALRKIGTAVMSVLLALIVFGLLPAQTSYAATLAPIPVSIDYFADDSGTYPDGDEYSSYGNWIGTHFELGVSESVLQFDLSTIPSTDTVTSALIKLYVLDPDFPIGGTADINVYGSNNDSISESTSSTVPSKDQFIVTKTFDRNIQNTYITIDIASYINSQLASGDHKATLILTGRDISSTPNTSNEIAVVSKSPNTPADKADKIPTLNVTTSAVPKVTSVAVPGNGTYVVGQPLDFTVSFDRNVTVTGTPQLPLTIGSTNVSANYVSGSGSKLLSFRYTVAINLLDTDGIALGNTINLNSGLINNSSTSEAANLTLTNVGSLTNVKIDSVVPTVYSVAVPANAAYGSGQSLEFTVKFNETVTVAGGTPSLGLTIGSTSVQAAYSSGSGSDSLVFRYTLQDGQSDMNGITVHTLALNGATMKDAAGNEAVLTLNSIGSTAGVLVDTAAPTVNSVDVPVSGTYKTGDQLHFTVRYDENANVTGTPYLPVTIGSSSVQANFVSGSGTKDLLFRYTVQAGDLDADGIQPGSSLVLNGGAIRDAASNNASLTLTGVGANTVLVDAVAPMVNSVTVPTGQTYLAEDALNFTVRFSETVTVTGTPFLPVTIGGTSVQAQYTSGSGTSYLVFRYTVQAGDSDANGITVASDLNLNGGTIQDAVSNNANLILNSVGDTTAVLVDAVAPTVSSVNVPASYTYGPAANLDFTVHFAEKVVIAGGTPSIPLTIGSSTVHAEYLSGTGTDTLVFRYVVQPSDSDHNGIEVGSAISLNGSTLKDEAGNAASLALAGVEDPTAVLIDTTASAVTSVDVPADSSYQAGAVLEFTVHYDENVAVTGTPTLPITIGSATVQASYVSGSGTSELLFRYTILDGQEDADGIEVGSAMAPNDGALKDAAGNSADLNLIGVGNTSQILVDAVAPSVASIDVPAAGIYKAGNVLNMTIHYDEKVTVTGSPYVTVTIGSTAVHAAYASGSGTNSITFSYSVQSGDEDADGVELGGAVVLNGGALHDAAGNPASLSLAVAGSTDGVLVDTAAPAATSVDVPDNGIYKAGDILNFAVHYNEKVTVTGGTPFLPVTIGSTAVHAVYVSGSGTNALLFLYEVQAGDHDADGIQAGSALGLNGAAVQDAAGNAAELNLTTGSTSGVLVDTSAPSVSSVQVPGNGYYHEGSTLSFTVRYSEKVTVTGTPTIPITIGASTVQAVYVSGSNTDSLVFSYTILSGQLDLDGISVGSSLHLNDGSMKDSAGNTAALTLASVGNTSHVFVDAIAPSIDSVDLPANATYVAGEHLDFTIHYDEAVKVTGTPTISITLGAATVQAQYVSGSGTQDLLFRYTVQTGDNDSDGIEAGALNLNGGTLKDATGNNAEAVLSGLGSTAGVKADAVAPAVTRVDVPANGSYKVGTTLQFTIHYGEKVTVTGGTPKLDIVLDGKTVQAEYVSGSGTDKLVFRYEVQAGDMDSNGIQLATGIMLNGAAIADQAGNSAATALAGTGDTSAVLLDTTAPVVSLVGVPADGTYHAGAKLDFIVKFNEPVTLAITNGIPSIEVQIGSSIVIAEYLEAVSATELKFRYTVRLEDQDPDGISIESDALNLNGAVVSDAAGNSFGATLNGIGATQNVKVSNNLSISLSETSWTKNDVTVTVASDPDNAIEYKLGSSGTWTGYAAPVVVSQEGLTTVYVRVIDPENNIGEVKSVEAKIDKTAPVIVLNGNDTVIVYSGSTYAEQGAIVQDANPAAPLATVTGTVDPTKPGTYTLHYNAADLAGNQAVEVTRTVNVVNRPVSNTNVRQVRVEVGDPDHPQVVVQIDIVRETIGGKKVDTVVMNEDKIKQAVESALGAHQGTVRIIVDDIPGDPADQVKVKLSVNAIKYLLDSSIQVEIQTDNATLHLSTEALGAMKGSQEFYFDILPIRKKDEQDKVKDRTINAEAIRHVVKSGTVSVIGMPMTIETNLPKVAVQVTFPLDSNVIPSDLTQRKQFLATLGVYIEHSDGEKVFQRGKIVYNDKGYPVGIQIEVNKFSMFTIVSAEGASVHHEAYMTGYSDGTFRPNQSVTRAEMSTMLYRLLSGTITGKGTVAAFKDVSGSYWAAEAIRWGQQVGLLNGYPDRSFKPNATITRAEMAAIIAQWLKLDPAAANPAFRDIEGHWASAQIAAAAKLGYMTGYSDGTFRPEQPLTRAEAVVILNRILDRGPLTGVTTPAWKDVPTNFWAFGAIEEASRSHDAARDSNGKETYIPE